MAELGAFYKFELLEVFRIQATFRFFDEIEIIGGSGANGCKSNGYAQYLHSV